MDIAGFLAGFVIGAVVCHFVKEKLAAKAKPKSGGGPGEQGEGP